MNAQRIAELMLEKDECLQEDASIRFRLLAGERVERWELLHLWDRLAALVDDLRREREMLC